MQTYLNKTTCLTALGVAALLGSGCKTIIRENIVSSIDTGFGATIMENKQTQVPEIKVGYIRTQFYSVPTGKVVENDNGAKGKHHGKGEGSGTDRQTNAANVTPEMVAGIQTDSGFQSLIFGLKISESFAIGKDAVKSDAATAMYVASAKDAKTAEQAALAVRALPADVMSTTMEIDSIKIYKQYKAADVTVKPQWDAVVSANTKWADMKDLVAHETPEDWDVVIKGLKNKGLYK